MSGTLETVFAWTFYGLSFLSFFAVCYEFHVCSERYVKREARRKIKKDLIPPHDYETGQYYFDFMKDYM